MKLFLPFLGKTKESYLDQGINDYAERLRRYLSLDIKVLKCSHGKNDSDQVIMTREAELLLHQTTGASLTVAPDPAEPKCSEERS